MNTVIYHSHINFEPRHYHSDLSIWLSVDPMADKYPNLSPYVYCGNNPVKLVDPDGRTIVDENGDVCYTQKDGWLPNASEDTKRIGNALMATETGNKQFIFAVESEAKISFKIEKTKTKADNAFGTGILTINNAQNGNYKLLKAEITLYEAACEAYFKGTSEVNINNDLTPMGSLSRLAHPTITEYLGAVAGHEIEHLKPDNILLQFTDPSKIEQAPEYVKCQILNDLINLKENEKYK